MSVNVDTYKGPSSKVRRDYDVRVPLGSYGKRVGTLEPVFLRLHYTHLICR